MDNRRINTNRLMFIRRGDLTIRYRCYPGEPADRWYPGSRPYVEIHDVTWRGRPVRNIKDRNIDSLITEIEAAETAAYERD